ncbi:hypothetical protein F5884DRAFT_898962 [Xylogone sp. PMI_703]|nr:hypothetical protein F5884DRAFT_898962 [Xylogone sp. PMI_703]
MKLLSDSLIAALAIHLAAAVSTHEARDIDCPDGQNFIQTEISEVCCPGQAARSNGKIYCCYGVPVDSPPLSSLTSCKASIDVDDPNYAQEVLSKTGISVTVSGSTTGSSSSPSSAASSSPASGVSGSGGSSTSAPPATSTDSGSPTPASSAPSTANATTGAASNNSPFLYLMACLMAIPIALLSL